MTITTEATLIHAAETGLMNSPAIKINPDNGYTVAVINLMGAPKETKSGGYGQWAYVSNPKGKDHKIMILSQKPLEKKKWMAFQGKLIHQNETFFLAGRELTAEHWNKCFGKFSLFPSVITEDLGDETTKNGGKVSKFATSDGKTLKVYGFQAKAIRSKFKSGMTSYVFGVVKGQWVECDNILLTGGYTVKKKTASKASA